MKINCQTCGQTLPKTAVMCPNCGGRSFLPVNHNGQNGQSGQFNQIAQPQAIQPTQNAWSTQPQQPQQPQPQIQPQPQPQPQPTYVPPVYVPPPSQPVPPQQSQPSYSSYQNYQSYPSEGYQQTYTQDVYEQPQVLPPSTYNSKKFASQMLYASVFKRGFAFLFDVILVGLLLGLAYQLLLPEVVKQLRINGINTPTLIIVATTFYLLYMSIFTSSGRQGTIGKIIMGLWVYGMNGQRINFFHALFREMLKVVLLPLFFIMWFTARKQTMADLLARTVVLYDPS